MSQAKVVFGAQWGDEGKGKVVDQLGAQADLVARCMGGNNAGHTTVYKGEPLILHLLPSSVAHGKAIAIGAGVVLDPFALVNEVKYVSTFGLDCVNQMNLDLRTALVMVYHRVWDLCEEILRGGKAIGTTARGIGPAYADVANRCALRTCDLLDFDRFSQKATARLNAVAAQAAAAGITREQWQEIFQRLTAMEIKANQRLIDQGLIDQGMLNYNLYCALSDQVAFDIPNILNHYHRVADEIKSWGCLCDVSRLIHTALHKDECVLIEGAQGAHLDILFGTWPFVTASHTIAGGACVGLGIGPGAIGEVHGVFKAYTTRVGNGPFPTRMPEELAAMMRGSGSAIGDEFGASTGRPRDCGWLDLPVVISACAWNDADTLTMTKLDKLSGLPEIKIGKYWQLDGAHYDYVPADYSVALNPCLDIAYETLPGWQQNISGCRRFGDLPAAARNYVHAVQTMLNDALDKPVAITQIGVGPAADEIIRM